MAHAYHKAHPRGPLSELPVFNHDKKQTQKTAHDALLDRLSELSEPARPLPAENLKNNKMLDNTTDYYHCGGKRNSSKSVRNLSAPKPRPPASAASIVNETSRRVNSMRILSTTNPLSGEGLPLDWRDDNHYSLSKPKRGNIGTAVSSRRPRQPFNLDSPMDTSISFSNELIPATKTKPAPRQQSPSSNKAKAAFKYLSAKIVTDKLVKALTKDRTSSHGNDANKQGEHHSTDKQRGTSTGQENAVNANVKANGSITGSKVSGHLARLVGHPTRANDTENGYSGSPPRESIEYGESHDASSYRDGNPSNETRLTNSHIINPTADEVSFYEVLDPLEAHARAYEEQAIMLGTGNELSDVLIRTLVHDGDFEYDTLEIHIDVLRKEFRKHIEDKKDLALKMAAELRARLLERVRAEEMLKKTRVETENKVRMMEREVVEMKSRFQEEMEESEMQWTSKLEKLRSKEKRLSERLKEILEEKVELHKEVSALTTKKDALLEEVQGYQESIKEFKAEAEESSQEAVKLRKLLEESMKRLSERDGQGKATEEDGNTLGRKYRHKEREVMEKQKAVSKLQKLCKEQDKTIAGLRFALGEQANSAQLQGKGEFFVKLQRELVRLSGIEQGLRKEVDSYKTEVVAAKRENAILVDRLGTIMRKLGNVAIRLADSDSLDPEHPSREAKSCNQQDNAGIMRVEEINDEQEAEFDLRTSNGNDDMAIVLLGHSSNSASSNLLDVVAKGSKMSEVHDLITSRLESHCEEREDLEKLQEDVQILVHTKDRLQEEASNLHSALSLTNRRVHELETELASKEGELGGMKEELGRVQEQRDNVQKEADFMGREAIRLSTQVDRLRRKIERLDEDVMLKDGQLSILRGALHENSQ
ncbi:hypothetical protein GOP47_0016886 [Adiantum capillus-veneris]|uniref:Uncharacterized protein n=1 Tax=Adiantum capillus-veneris TaxID=13818 RepID=A0A9D4UII9_ADICA|nr:hypothetical protein GOP47_0016886 [Adiantum capillus-veneris]